jgi:hypothetical protein
MRHREKGEGQRRGSRRPGRRGAQLGAGRRQGALGLRDAAEEPRRDLAFPHPFTQRPQRVAQLVHEDRAEEKHRRHHGHDEVGEPDNPG